MAAGLATIWLTGSGAWLAALAVLGALVVSLLVVTRAVRRLGGITGDVLGAAAEIAQAAALVLLAVSATVSA